MTSDRVWSNIRVAYRIFCNPQLITLWYTLLFPHGSTDSKFLDVMDHFESDWLLWIWRTYYVHLYYNLLDQKCIWPYLDSTKNVTIGSYANNCYHNIYGLYLFVFINILFSVLGCVDYWLSFFVLFILAIASSVLRFTASYNPFGIFKLSSERW
jgi:hypothetical protein